MIYIYNFFQELYVIRFPENEIKVVNSTWIVNEKYCNLPKNGEDFSSNFPATNVDIQYEKLKVMDKYGPYGKKL